MLWVGEGLEGFMARAVRNLPPATRVLKLIEHPEMALLPARAGGVWERAHHDPGAHDDDDNGALDHHLWLDPANARLIVRVIADELVTLDRANAARYRANAARVTARLTNLEHDLRRALRPLENVPFLVFHDAWQYFEKRFGLHFIGAAVAHPESLPGARRMRELREAVRTHMPRCVFDEPQFNPRVVAALVADTGIGYATLDPLGATLPPGAGAYFLLMENAAATLAACPANQEGPRRSAPQSLSP